MHRSAKYEDMNLEGVILAGGRGRRMGGVNKGRLQVSGVPMIESIAGQMRDACVSFSIAVASDEQAALYAGLGVPAYPDALPGCGPLAAVHAALCRAERPMVWISACDMPFVSAAAALVMKDALLSSGAEAAVPRIGGRLHPLQAVYRAECREAAYGCLAGGEYRMLALLERLNVVRLSEEHFAAEGIDCRFVANVNTPEEYERLLGSSGQRE